MRKLVWGLAIGVGLPGVLLVRAASPAAAVQPAVPLPGTSAMPVYGYTIVRSFPHDREAFTQGLQFHEGVLYEGTGLEGRSTLRKVALETGTVLQSQPLDAQYFGEGITLFRSSIFQLTWKSGVAFVYDRTSFKPTGRFQYRGEGWGLTHDGKSLIMSDGTDELRILDPATFKELRRVRVTALGRPVPELNELEYVKGEIFANIWQTDTIARIDPASGRVTGMIDLRGLLSPRERLGTDVLNGIAYDAAGDRLFVTGKLWPRIFEITLQRRP